MWYRNIVVAKNEETTARQGRLSTSILWQAVGARVLTGIGSFECHGRKKREEETEHLPYPCEIPYELQLPKYILCSLHLLFKQNKVSSSTAITRWNAAIFLFSDNASSNSNNNNNDMDKQKIEKRASLATESSMGSAAFCSANNGNIMDAIDKTASSSFQYPRLCINTAQITANTRKVVTECKRRGIEPMAVTKGVCGDANVVDAMLEGGIRTIGDSRLENLARLRSECRAAPFRDDNSIDNGGVQVWLIRSPAPQEVEACVRLCHGSLQGDMGVLRLMNQAMGRLASSQEPRQHRVVLMVDITQREGMLPEEVLAAVDEIKYSLPNLHLQGLGLYADVSSDPAFRKKAQSTLVSLAAEIRARKGLEVSWVSGGSSNIFGTSIVAAAEEQGIPMEEHKIQDSNTDFGWQMPSGVTHLRLGCSILLGSCGYTPVARHALNSIFPRPTGGRRMAETIDPQKEQWLEKEKLRVEHRQQMKSATMYPMAIPGFHTDAFVLDAVLIEVKRRPRRYVYGDGNPDDSGTGTEDDADDVLVGIVSLGKVDIDPQYVYPQWPLHSSVVRTTSDHMVLDLSYYLPEYEKATNIRSKIAPEESAGVAGLPATNGKDFDSSSAVPLVGSVVTFQMGYQAMKRAVQSQYVQKKYTFF